MKETSKKTAQIEIVANIVLVGHVACPCLMLAQPPNNNNLQKTFK